ncbi:MAG TPA: copper resistance protein CopC [Candidatus Rokubacteria bacterium]|nr:copper resistance protein CopC [Candidatus Rokubacteria bacterium]
MLRPVVPLAALALVLVLLASVSGTGAHAALARSEPRAGATLGRAPSAVRLWFTGDLEPAFGRLRVLDAAGARVDRDDARVDRNDRTLLRATLGPLPPGRYRVLWRVVSVDSHVTEGEFGFRVAP